MEQPQEICQHCAERAVHLDKSLLETFIRAAITVKDQKHVDTWCKELERRGVPFKPSGRIYGPKAHFKDYGKQVHGPLS